MDPTSRPSRPLIALLILALVAFATAACQTGVTMWTACTPAPDGDPTGTDGTYVLECRNGRWEPLMTVDEFTRSAQGEKVKIAPLPKPPTSTTTTTTTSTTTTTAPPVLEVDAQYVATPNGVWLTGHCTYRSAAQSFVAGRTGQLTQVDLAAVRESDPAPLLITIHPIVDGEPGETVLGSGSYAGPDSPDWGTLVEVALSSPATVTAGQSYALVATTSTCSAIEGWLIPVRTNGTYADGNGFWLDEHGDWIPETTDDVIFRTWVVG